MTRLPPLALSLAALLLVSAFALPARRGRPAWSPWADNNGQLPPKSQYTGPFFQLSHAYPASVDSTPAAFPWQTAIGNGTIDTGNAAAYVAALKGFVAADMRVLLDDYAHWDAARRGWFNEPWLGDSLREAIHGTYVGNDYLPADQFPHTGLTKPFSTYVLTYYDARAANTLFKVWGRTGRTPSLATPSTQFAEGAVVVKLAFSTANGDVWPVMRGARTWPVYITTNATTGGTRTPQVDSVSLFQIDIVVKDSRSAPRTGWVFSTLVFDNRRPGEVWDQMVPLGAQWGDDPGINSAIRPAPPLQESWINPAAPPYSTTTLGWGGRLSGPNDGAVSDVAIARGAGYDTLHNVAISSCLSCHSTAQWPLKSFLLPSPTPRPRVVEGGYLVVPSIGGPPWLRWYQNRLGTQPMDSGSVATDFDMVFAFKSFPLWQYATTGRTTLAVKATALDGMPRRVNQYTGRPVPVTPRR